MWKAAALGPLMTAMCSPINLEQREQWTLSLHGWQGTRCHGSVPGQRESNMKLSFGREMCIWNTSSGQCVENTKLPFRHAAICVSNPHDLFRTWRTKHAQSPTWSIGSVEGSGRKGGGGGGRRLSCWETNSVLSSHHLHVFKSLI